MGKALIVIVVVVLLVYAFFDLVATPSTRVKYLPKLVWFAVVVLVPVVGPLLWVLLGQRRDRPQPPRPPGGEYGWPGGRPPAKGPDDDPDFLRGL
jgi:8-oxo-dGTP pyrophosphatase MutT (NUDIX family)